MVLKLSGLFNTPDTWEDLEKWILQHSRDQHVSLLTSAHMARNYTIKQLQEESDNG
jgi:hypothetical protein